MLDSVEQYALRKGVKLIVTGGAVRLASVDLRNGEYLVSTYSTTADGFDVMEGLPARLPGTALAGELGQAVIDALVRSREDIPTPGDLRNVTHPLLDMIGVRDYTSYARGVRQVSVIEDENRITVTPTHNGGRSAGFTPKAEQAVEVLYRSPGRVGEAVVEALEHAS